MEGPAAAAALDSCETNAAEAYARYVELLNEGDDGQPLDPGRAGLARELARMVLPLNAYTQWYWKMDLHNLLHFLALRADPHAQYEIRAYAEVLLDVVRRWVPLTYAAFVDYRLEGAELSAKALAVVRRMLARRDRRAGRQWPLPARVARAGGAPRAGLSAVAWSPA